MGLPPGVIPISPTGSTVSPADGGGDSAAWLSGLSGLFTAAAGGIATGLRASNIPSGIQPGSGWVYNPSTGQYYNPVTGQALTATGTLTSAGGLLGSGSNSTFLIILLVGLFLLLRRKGSAGG
jgi:hypothetical protein